MTQEERMMETGSSLAQQDSAAQITADLSGSQQDNSATTTPGNFNNNAMESPSSDISIDTGSDEDSDSQSDAHSNDDIAEQEATKSLTVQNASSKKRKSPTRDQNDSTEAPAATSSKKVKLDGLSGSSPSSSGVAPGVASQRRGRDSSSLPAELWHRIFTFCPPRSLGNLLLTNKLFNSYLDPSSTMECPRPESHTKPLFPALKPNAIWQASRRLFWPNMPNPLQDISELGMWRLACSHTCQCCGKRPAQTNTTSISDPMRPGPGEDGIATVWSFAANLCWTCLSEYSVKEIDLLLSSSFPSVLMPALPFVFSTHDFQVLSPSALERSQPPAGSSYTKRFWSAHVNGLKDEFISVKELGAPASEEWLKGLEGRGTAKRQDASKWEKFAASGGVSQMCTSLYPGYQPSQLPAASLLEGSRQAPANEPGSRAYQAPTIDNATTAHSAGNNPHFGMGTSTSRITSGGRSERTRDQATELKASRRFEIVQRARLLDPPITATLLGHMPAFQAAIQITAPLDDNAWNILKPRLLAQRADAEEREKETEAIARNELNKRRGTKAEGTALTNEPTDEEWEDIQGPLRAHIAGLADDLIRDHWDEGDKLTKENSPKFAADVLIYVRKHFYEDIAKEAAAARAAGKEPTVDPPQGPFTQKLTLENMKWIFDTKIKPHTESYRKELFLCNGCESKYYGFEGVIQHFAAKHTSILSQGSVVVFWRAEWPEHPPFRPDARQGNRYMHQGNPSITQQATAGSYGQPPYSSAPIQQSPAPYFPPTQAYGAQPPYSGAYPPQPPGPYPQTSYPPGHASYGAYAPQMPGYQAYAPPTGAPGQYPVSTSEQSYGVQPAPAGYGQNYSAFQQNAYGGYPMSHGAPPVHPDRYRAQFEDMAQMARELWVSTGVLKDFPGGVRVHIIIHHLAKRFQTKFAEAAPLTMFIDGLSNNKDMRPVRNINGIACKTCHLGLGDPEAVDPDKKWLSLPQLANHFQSKHIDPHLRSGRYEAPPNWTTDMVLLPELDTLFGLRYLANTDPHKSFLIFDAIPQLAEDPAASATSSQAPAPISTLTPDHPAGTAPSQDNHSRFYNSGSKDGEIRDSMSGTPNQSHPGGYHSRHISTGGAGYTAPQSDAHAQQAAMQSAAVAHGSTYYNQDATISSVSMHDQASRVSSQGAQSGFETGRNGKKQKGSKGGKKRGGGSDSGPTLSKAQRARRNEAMEAAAKKAEEEEQRQEDQIRAMWAADRVQTAAAAQPTGAASGSAVANNKSKDRKSGAADASSGQNSKRAVPSQANKPPSRQQSEDADDREEPSLLDALEMHLGQEEEAYRAPVPAPAPASPPQPRVMKQRGGYLEPRYAEPERYTRPVDAPPATHRRRSQSPPAHARYTSVQQPGTYRDRSPLRREPGPVYQSRQAQDLDDVRYEPAPRQQEYYAVQPADEPRVEYDRRRAEYAPQPVEFEPRHVEYERYELIQVRGPEGDYYIRRPIRREVEIDGERYYVEERQPPPVRYATYDPYPYGSAAPAPARYESQAPPPAPEYLRRDEVAPAPVEEYDPRFPALPPSSGGRQLRRYD